jgi:two-component system LytT family response regulator
MKTIKTILIDDEPLAIVEMKSMLAKNSDIQIVGEANSGTQAQILIEKEKPDLIFLDIQMPGMTGFELLEKLEHIPYVIFVTAYDQFALKAFEVSALDYLLKPVNALRLDEAIQKFKKINETKEDKNNKLTIDKRIFIKDGDQCHFVALNEVYLIESVGNYARIYYQNKKPLLHKSLNYLEERLPESSFFRTDRQHIVNIHYIKNIYPYFNSTLQIELQSGEKIEVSQRQSVKFKDLMGI